VRNGGRTALLQPGISGARWTVVVKALNC